jgi:hypothetical protein
MAKGPQSNPRVVAAALEALMAAYNSFVSAEKAQQLAALQPVQLGLLWAAGWLLPCFTQGSRLPPALQANARSACCSFMSLATRLLTLAPPSDQAGFVALLNQCGRPQVPSECHRHPCYCTATTCHQGCVANDTAQGSRCTRGA